MVAITFCVVCELRLAVYKASLVNRVFSCDTQLARGAFLFNIAIAEQNSLVRLQWWWPSQGLSILGKQCVGHFPVTESLALSQCILAGLAVAGYVFFFVFWEHSF